MLTFLPIPVPLTVMVICLLVNQHPSPVDNCSCFEDTIMFISIILGIVTSFWYSKHVPALNADLFASVTPGAAFDSPVAVMAWMFFALHIPGQWGCAPKNPSTT
jgi:hypothetical protein